MRKLIIVGVFFLGVIVGGLGALYLAGRAVPTYARGLEVLYIFQQQQQAAVAAKNEHWSDAAPIYRNIALLESNPDKPFGVENQQWDLTYPFAALVLEQIVKGADPQGKGKALSLGIAYAKYAFALENAGRKEEASAAWDKALQLGGFHSIEAARGVALTLINQEIQLFGKQ